MDEDLYIYPYKASMLVPCPFETLKLELDASKTEINQAADAMGTDEADDARRKALSIYYHPPCNKARRLKRMRELDKGPDDERHMRKVLEKVVLLYKTEFYHVGLRGKPGFDENEFTTIKSKWNEQVRYEAEEIFWNGYGDCRTKLRKTEEKARELEAEVHRLKSNDKQQVSCNTSIHTHTEYDAHSSWKPALRSRPCSKSSRPHSSAWRIARRRGHRALPTNPNMRWNARTTPCVRNWTPLTEIMKNRQCA